MTAVSAEQSYAFAFKLGAVGSIVLLLSALVAPLLASLLALAVWTLVTIFVLPWLYVCYHEGDIRVPPWAYRGPHQ